MKTFEYEEYEILYGSYFFYSTNKVEHHRDAMNYLGVFAEYGGLQALLISVLSIFGSLVNGKLL